MYRQLDKEKISIIIPMRNEASSIKKCLGALLNQDYPPDKLEILAVDGLSDDKSREIVSEYSKAYNFIKLLDNPRYTATSGMNIGIKNASGEIIVILSAHSGPSEDFIQKNVEFLNKTGADCVGGVLETIGKSYLGQAIALVLSSPFGVGGARFRYTQRAGYVDTVAYGAYRREVFDKIGLFDERLVRNQDIEFNSRLRKAEGKIYLTPEIKSYYYSPETLGKFCRQAFSNGLWNIKTARLVRGAMRPRHFVPLLFLVALAASAILSLLSFLGYYLFGIIAGSYLALALLFSASIASRKGWRYFPILPFLFLSLHISYGIGSLWGIIKWDSSPKIVGRNNYSV